jgi:7-carboxy-7-deazaguanine synthase
VSEVVDQLAQYSAKHVVLTGGEPMIWSASVPLAMAIRKRGLHLTIETAGTIYLPLECDLWSISPKLAGSGPEQVESNQQEALPLAWQAAHDRRRHRLDVVRLMMQQNYQLKFVVNTPADADEVLKYLANLPQANLDRTMIMPQGTTVQELQEKSDWLRSWCGKHGLRYCPRSHIQWYGNKRGT